jgi:uncharacterized protein
MAEAILSPGVFQNESDQSLVQRGIVGSSTAIVGPTVLGQPYIPTYVTSYSEYIAKFGETFKSGSYYYEYLTSLAAKDFFQNGGQTLLVTRIISGSANYSTYASSSVGDFAASANSFELETLAWGNQMNSVGGTEVSGALPSGSSTNVRWEIINVQTGSGTFSLGIRAGNDNNAQKNYLETWPNLSLDPMLPNYISRVVGDLKPVYDATNNVINYTGSYANASQFVRVKSVTGIQPDSFDNNGAYKAAQYSGSLPALGSGSFGGGVAATGASQLMNEAITVTNIQGFGGDDYIEAFQLLNNKDDFQFNVLLAPGLTLQTTGNAVSTMISTCEDRGDAIAIVDTRLYGSTVANAATSAAGQNSNYAATYWPWIQLFSSGLGKAVWSPASSVIGGVFAFNDQVGAEWFAPAGLNRGGVPAVLRAERKLSQADRDTLYNANVNPLATFPGEGVVVFGQKTLQKKQTALDRVNVRRLLIALKNYIGQVGNNLVFEQNTNVTRNRFLSQVNPYLESVVQRQGLYAYKVVMDDSNNTPDVIDRNQLVGQIYIQPTKTAEFIILNFNVQPTGASFPA